MKHIKQRLLSPLAAGCICHTLSQRVGLAEFRSAYRHHRNEDRSRTASGLLRARQHVRAQVAHWQAELAADAVQADKVRILNSAHLTRWKKRINK